MKLKLLKLFNYWWDVLFTLVDYGQLYIYFRTKKLENKLYEQQFTKRDKKLKLEDHESWDQVQ